MKAYELGFRLLHIFSARAASGKLNNGGCEDHHAALCAAGRDMRKIILFMMVSLDGYFEAPGHDISWHNVDDEFNKFAIEQLSDADLLLFGKRTYELFESFWPAAEDDPRMTKDNLKIAHMINNAKKIVFSTTLKGVKEKRNWKNVRLMRKVDADEIRKLKKMPGKDIWIGGSSMLCASLVNAGLLDEMHIMVSPVLIGKGTALLRGINDKVRLELLKTRSFKSGNILLYYRVVK